MVNNCGSRFCGTARARGDRARAERAEETRKYLEAKERQKQKQQEQEAVPSYPIAYPVPANGNSEVGGGSTVAPYSYPMATATLLPVATAPTVVATAAPVVNHSARCPPERLSLYASSRETPPMTPYV